MMYDKKVLNQMTVESRHARNAARYAVAEKYVERKIMPKLAKQAKKGLHHLDLLAFRPFFNTSLSYEIYAILKKNEIKMDRHSKKGIVQLTW